jgi:hypothetical protein
MEKIWCLATFQTKITNNHMFVVAFFTVFGFLKGTVPPDFFFKQLLLAPVAKPSSDFDFLYIRGDI